MSFDLFSEVGLREFVAANRDDSALWLFIHIPKTAGSSLAAELHRLRRPYRNIFIDYTRRDISFEEQMQRAVDDFIREAREKRILAASGHLTIDNAREIRAAIPNTKFVTFLRDPIARVVSDYRYARTPKHPPFRDFIAAYPDIETYVEKSAARNKMSRHVGGSDLPGVFAEFDFIGALELYPMSFNIFFSLMGEDVLPELHERKTQQTADNEVSLSPALIDAIQALNAEDVRLFESVRDMLRARRAEWQDWRGIDVKPASALN